MCGCSSGSGTAKRVPWVVTKPDGTKISYNTEVEAIAAAKRTGGSYKAGT